MAPSTATPAIVADPVHSVVAMQTAETQAPAAASPIASSAAVSTASVALPTVESAPILAIPAMVSNSMDITSNLLAPPSNMYTSNEQLERDLDDLPFLDVEEMPMSVISGDQSQLSLDVQQSASVTEASFTGMIGAQPEEQKNDDEDEADADSDSESSGDEAASNKSWSPLPSPSPNSSPAPSASPSP